MVLAASSLTSSLSTTRLPKIVLQQAKQLDQEFRKYSDITHIETASRQDARNSSPIEVCARHLNYLRGSLA